MAVGPLGGFLVDRRRLPDGAFGTTATLITREGVARGPAIPLTDERAPIPSIPGTTHAWSAVARWKDGFVIATSVGPAGDLWDDSGVLVYVVADPTAKELPRPVRVTIGQALEGDVVGLADGTVVLAAQLAGAPTRNPYALVTVRPDGTFERLPPPIWGSRCPRVRRALRRSTAGSRSRSLRRGPSCPTGSSPSRYATRRVKRASIRSSRTPPTSHCTTRSASRTRASIARCTSGGPDRTGSVGRCCVSDSCAAAGSLSSDRASVTTP